MSKAQKNTQLLPASSNAISAALMLSASEVAELLGICRAHVWKLHSCGKLPSPLRFGRVVRWHRETLCRWLAAGAPSRDRFEAISQMN